MAQSNSALLVSSVNRRQTAEATPMRAASRWHHAHHTGATAQIIDDRIRRWRLP
jgi:hypothetical protein